jgi:3-methyladenine DNA glycosylase Tag
MASRERTRCKWTGTREIDVRYHDEEWGVPTYDDRSLFEFLVLEGAQAGMVNDHVRSCFRYRDLGGR